MKTITAEHDPYIERDRRAKAMGWKHLSFDRCPLVLVDRQCRADANLLGETDEKCLCQSRLNDHGARWRDSRGDVFVLWEPYGAFDYELMHVFAEAMEDGLRVEVTTSVWYPGRAIGIRFEPRDMQ